MQLARRTLLTYCTALAVGKVAAAPRSVILVVGDSLSAEYGLARGSGWVALLDRRLAHNNVAASVINASISGDTTAGGRARLAALLAQHRPTLVIVELGANDALRGLPLGATRDNLLAIVRAAQAAHAQVLVLGMQVPPNYGRQYSAEFAGLYAAVARSEKIKSVPFFLSGVADAPNSDALFQADRLHPNEHAQATLLDNVWRVLRTML